MEFRAKKLDLGNRIATQDTLAGDLLVVPMTEGDRRLPPAAVTIAEAVSADLVDELRETHLTGKPGEIASSRPDFRSVKRMVAIGIGEKTDAAATRNWGKAVIREARRLKAKHVTVLLPSFDVARAFAEGVVLGNYAFLIYKAEDKKKREESDIVSVTAVFASNEDPDDALTALRAGEALAGAANAARDMVNTPASDMTPTALRTVARVIAEAYPDRVSLTSIDQEQLEALGMNGIVGVGKGSDEPMYLLHLSYVPQDPKTTVALVGKGVCFDSGGLSLKTADGMEDMKIDMTGGAIVLAVIAAAAQMGLPVAIHGIVAAVENMPSGKAIKPADVLRMGNGKTVEVLNTDAEGRLILADALHYASTLRPTKPSVIVDLATLTGAAMAALGTDIAALYASDDKLADALKSAADAEGELLWRMPLHDGYDDKMKSDIADLKNISGTRYGGSITAALFLRNFVDKAIPWAHLDIAGPVTDKDRLATGYGVRTLLHWLRML
jgi:leucyl aminopeptidase